MFDYQVSKHPHFDEACRAFALRHNLVQLAERAGMNVQILRNKLNPAQPHLLTAPEIWLLTDLTEDSTLVTGQAVDLLVDIRFHQMKDAAFREMIRLRSHAVLHKPVGTRREKSWHKTTVGEVVQEIAARHKLKMALGKDLSDKPVEHIDQTNESDGSFLMRLARQYGAIASVKNGNLLFIRQGQGKSATGKPLPVITITRKDGDSHRFTLADRGAYTGVIASWLHTCEPAKKESTTVKRKRRTKKQKKEPEAKQGDYLVGTDENVLVLNRTYANRSNAERAAKMQWERLQRGVASFSLQLAEGRADLYTEMSVKVSGFKQPIDDAEWTITTLTHTVSPDNGFTTSLELEVRIDDFEME
ncbi:TPA: phage regulatory CII family protein [Escherichia coli]|nr:phage late control D family protein [Escherichia coli]EFC1236032.1 phage late control D family protein [Escherichia coli]EFC2466597.1 phage late control D family protein [Escherichia coli]EFD5302171.1 phage late control D family protein [Escherichia coli]EFD5330046.1 phage late control D family protein [Escherichia coli]